MSRLCRIFLPNCAKGSTEPGILIPAKSILYMREEIIGTLNNRIFLIQKIPSSEYSPRAEGGGFIIYYEENNGYEWTMWIHPSEISLIRFVQR